MTGVLVVLAVVVASLPAAHQQLIAQALRGSVLKPFVLAQESVANVRVQATSSDELRARLDSMIAVLATHYTLSEENRRLRDLLSLGDRTGPAYRPSAVVRSGTAGSESMFHLNVGYEEGVRENAPVLVRSGLLGVIREVRAHSAIGMDWTHPEFRASAMTADGAVYGIVETRRGEFREQDRFLFNGTPFHVRLEEGTPVVTSGLGGIFPRGVPVGTVEGLAEAEGGWRKAYWLRPASHPGSATHVLVEVEGSGQAPADLSSIWPADSILHERYVRPRERAAETRAASRSQARADTTLTPGALVARGAEIFAGDSAGPRLLVRLDTTSRARPGQDAGSGTTPSPTSPAASTRPSTQRQPGQPEGQPPAGQQQAEPPSGQPEAEPPSGQRQVEPPQPDTTGAAPPSQPVVRNLEAVIDSTRAADTTSGDTTSGDTARPPPPDTNRSPPDTNRVAAASRGGG